MMRKELTYALSSIAVLFVVHAIEERKGGIVELASNHSAVLRWSTYFALVIVTIYVRSLRLAVAVYLLPVLVMDNANKRFFLNFVLMCGFIFVAHSPALYFNLVIDPESIFRFSDEEQRILPNERFVKMRYLLSHPDVYDAIMLGSSRVNHVDVSKIPGYHAYNFTVSSSGLEEHVEDLRRLIANGNKIKLVMIGVDDVSYTGDPSRNHSFSLAPYPASTFERTTWMVHHVLHVFIVH